MLAQKQYSFLQVNNTDGLVNNQVTCIYKDSRGFIWIGTSAGLSRYDGSGFVNYKHNSSDSTSIVDNYIVDIQEDINGDLWIETRWAYTVYDVTKEKFYNDLSLVIGKPNALNAEKIYVDNNKSLWIKKFDIPFYMRLDMHSETLVDVIHNENRKDCSVVNFLHANGNYYYLFSNGTIECYDGERFDRKFKDNFLSGKLGNDSLNTLLFVDAEDDIWFSGNNEGLYHYNSTTHNWKHYTVNSGEHILSSNLITKIIQDENGKIWVGTDHGGIDVINKFSGQVTKVSHQSDNKKSIAQNSITDLYLDDNNIIWVGTYKNGVSYYHESIHKFPHYKHLLSDPQSLPYDDVNCFTEDKNGNLWIGTNGGGLIFFNRTKNTFKSYLHNKRDPFSLSNNVVVSLFIDSKEVLWVGTFTGGLNRFDGQKFKRYQFDAKETNGLTSNNIWSIKEDENGYLWIGTLGGGIVLYDPSKDSFIPLPNKGEVNLPGRFVSQIYELQNGNMFIGTANGVAFYDIKEQRYKHHPIANRATVLPLTNKAVYAVLEDSRGLLWIATREGLIMFDPNSDYIKNFTAKDGLPEDVVNCIQEDEFHSIWISKSTGLSQIIVSKTLPDEEYTFKVYDFTQEDGLQDKEFNPNASYKTSKDELIFGGPNGFNLFESKKIKYNKVLPKVVFTDFQVYNQSISPKAGDNNLKLLDQSVGSTKSIELKHAMNVFSIHFTALDFFIPSKIRYKYQLQGFNDNWVSLDDNQHRVSYTNLNKGDYYFRVKASNNDGLWNEDYAELHIKILPPFYATPFAYFIYMLLVIGVLVYYRYSMLNKERLKFEIQQERLLSKQNHEMDEMKLRFLTNVSHEFRTPLTLILTPLDKLLKQTTSLSDISLLETIDRNAKQLLDLVNQLLDFRKLELHGLRYNPSFGDIVLFLKQVIQNFEDAFNKKGLKFTFKRSTEHFMFYFDHEKLQKVMMNLLSNALKFTPEQGKVSINLTVDEDKDTVEIVVRDNGVGIEKEDIDKVFVRFYQSERNKKLGLSGSGIGLNLAMEMVQLHKGTIRVESEKGQGAKFIVSLPIHKSEKAASETTPMLIPEEEVEPREYEYAKNSKPVILLVEDNIDFRTFMKEALHEKFTIHEASDGKIGFDTVHKILPDLIISDVMMPNMDGLEMCKLLRQDIRTSHIPLILLTARTADEDKIKGLEIGADDYITKPFNMDLLLLRVHKLLEKRSRQQKQFQKMVDIDPSEIHITSMDEKLIKKALATVEKNIPEAQFSVEDLSRELGMSRVYLYKKLLAITGKSPIEFIRIIRLKRGAQLLRESQMNIAEIAYEVGFNSPRYFSKYFKEEYGMLPTAYVKQHMDKLDRGSLS